jgi:hypothetical protein
MSRRSNQSGRSSGLYPAVDVWLVSIVAIVVAGLAQPVAADTIDPDNDGSQYAWAENVGWLNAEPLGDGGPGARIWADRAEGWIWAENIGWISLSCGNTSSCGVVPYEVTNDGAGNLAGFAWSENAGWVSFSCVNTMSCATVDYGVVVDPGTGELSGYAWAENLGWVSFSCINTASCATVDYRVKTEVPFVDPDVFADGFESGDTTEWDNTVP